MLVNQRIIQKFNEPGSYYSSYPTLSEWSHVIDSGEYSAALESVSTAHDHSNVLLYIHFPFCQKRCLYCACNATITRDEQRIEQFQEYLLRELDMMFDILVRKNPSFCVTEVHLGGGSPSMLSKHTFLHLIARLYDRINRSELKEFSIEVDPRTATEDKFIMYKESGITRLSFGVQEFSPEVQRVIKRIQPFELMQSLLTDRLRKDFPSINFDILYGLPLQTYQSFMDTIQKVIQLVPDRVTLIRYAHIPELRPHQRALDNYPIPNDAEKTTLFFDAARAFKSAGWEHVGIDHFALPDDSLAIAARDGTMSRNFGGYSSTNIGTILGIGPTATMRVGPLYVQNTYSLDAYGKTVIAGRFPVSRGFRLAPDDALRREVIDSILCTYQVDFTRVEEKYRILFSEYFEQELRELQSLRLEGIIDLSEHNLQVTADGRFFLRHVCKVFDTFLQSGKPYVISGP